MKALLFLPSLLGAVLLVPGCTIPSDEAYERTQAGNRLYQERAYAEALESYRKAQVIRPELPQLNFNAGTALHQRAEYGRARRELGRSLSAQDPALAARGYYNLGNTFYRMERLEEAIEEYKQALRLDPEDQDAKYNLEYALRQLKRRSAPGPGQASPQEGEPGQPQEGQGQGEPGERTGPSSQRPGGEAEELLRRALEKSSEELTIEDVLRILDALRDRELDIQVLLEGRPSRERVSGLPDW